MSSMEDLKRARSLARIADVQRNQALAAAVKASRLVVEAWEDVEDSRRLVHRASQQHASSGDQLQARQTQTFIAASASAEYVRRHADLLVQAATAWDAVSDAHRVLRGRERLVEKRSEALLAEQLSQEQKFIDEVSLGKFHRSRP